jgi:hypothetical protein
VVATPTSVITTMPKKSPRLASLLSPRSICCRFGKQRERYKFHLIEAVDIVEVSKENCKTKCRPF